MLFLTDAYHNIKIHSELCDTSYFGRYVDSDDDGTVFDDLVGYYDDNADEYDYNCGATKAVLESEHSAFVLKAPFNGAYHAIENYDKENDEYYFEDENEWVAFGGAESENYDNYCEAELNIYEKAIEEDLGEYFAEVRYYGTTIGGFPLYLQERCKFYTNQKPSDKSKKEVEEHGNCPIRSELWCALFIDTYGSAEFERLVRFIKNNYIEDLHYSNVGYRMSDGKPVLTDTSGYNE